jgi:hypothetical protein
MADDNGADLVRALRIMAELIPNSATYAEAAADWIEARGEVESQRLAKVAKEYADRAFATGYSQGVTEERAKHDPKVDVGEVRP